MMPIVVAEIGLNHCGSVPMAKELISLCADQKVDYVKFQKRTIDKVYSAEELARPKETQFGKTYGDEKRGLEFGKDEYDEIDKFCKSTGIGWFASVWDEDSVDFMAQYNPPYMKLASCCCNNLPLLRKVSASNIPSILSVGMSFPDEIETACKILYPCLRYLLSTTSVYPCPDNMMNMEKINTVKRQFGHYAKVGFSSHSEKIIFPVIASLYGAEMVEFHITLNHNLEGPDHKSSIAPVGLKRIMDHLRSIKTGTGSGIIYPFAQELKKGEKYPWRKKLDDIC